MIEGLAARWLLTAVFTAAGLTAVLPRRGPAESAQAASRVPAAFCGLMCAALIAMAWRSEPAAAIWLQVALFGSTALWCAVPGLTGRTGSGRVRWPRLPALLHTLTAGAMIWMLTSMPAAARIASASPARPAMPSMSRAAAPASVLAVTILFAVSSALASIPWLARAVGRGPRVKDPLAASHAAMSAGMAAMLLVTL